MFHHKEPFVKQKASSDVKGSLWNHLDKTVLLWHREAPLFLRVETNHCKPAKHTDTSLCSEVCRFWVTCPGLISPQNQQKNCYLK